MVKGTLRVNKAWILAFALIVGCAKPIPQTTYVPVPCPTPPIVTRPELPIKDLKLDDTIEMERKLWLATIQVLTGYCKQLETILDGYRPQ